MVNIYSIYQKEHLDQYDNIYTQLYIRTVSTISLPHKANYVCVHFECCMFEKKWNGIWVPMDYSVKYLGNIANNKQSPALHVFAIM